MPSGASDAQDDVPDGTAMTGAGSKRKFGAAGGADSSGSDVVMDTDADGIGGSSSVSTPLEDGSDETHSSSEYHAPVAAVTTKSGRQVAIPVRRHSNPATTSAAGGSGYGHGGTSRGRGRKIRQSERTLMQRLCRECGRSSSPDDNMIVFCDGCNECWHQHCHDPPVPDAAVANVDAEWLCAACEQSRRVEADRDAADKVSREILDRRTLACPLPCDLC